MKIFKTRTAKTILFVIGSLVLIRAILPTIITHQANKYLQNELEFYTGSIEDVDLAIWRGAYEIQGLTIEKKNSEFPPLLKVEEIDLSLAWRALFRGKILLDIDIYRPQVTLLGSELKEKRQTGTEDKKLKDTLAAFAPTEIESLRVHDGTFRFINIDLKVPLDATISDVEVSVRDLTNYEQSDEISLSTSRKP